MGSAGPGHQERGSQGVVVVDEGGLLAVVPTAPLSVWIGELIGLHTLHWNRSGSPTAAMS
ncbi:MAG: hypothetical protein GEV04_15765 [Actinophytocola sp.]|nr:hypothetical protein [Actinophytocola sp.]